MLARRKMRLYTLAELVGITAQNLSVLKTGRAKAIGFSTLKRLCEVLDCARASLTSGSQPTVRASAEQDLAGKRPSKRAVILSEAARPASRAGEGPRQITNHIHCSHLSADARRHSCPLAAFNRNSRDTDSQWSDCE